MHASYEQQDLTSLGLMVRTWRDRGDALPVAVVVSVFDDLLATEPNGKGGPLRIDDVTIDNAGFAHARRDPSLLGLGPLLFEVLGEDHAPAAARSLMDRLVSEDPEDHPIDAEQLRQWIRDSLGAPAAREEVVACAQEATGDLLPTPEPVDDDDDVHNLATELPTHAGPPDIAIAAQLAAPELASDTPAPTEAPNPQAVADTEVSPQRSVEAATELASVHSGPILVPEPAEDGDRVVSLPPERPAAENQLSTEVVRARDSDPPTALPSPLPATAEPQTPTELEQELDSNDLPRPVVRHPVAPRRSASVVSAPAARKSALASAHGRDSILVPAEQKKGWGWVVVIAVLAAAVYFLVLR